MLIEFSVENFGCFKNEVTLSFECMKDLDDTLFYNPDSRREIDVEGVDPINTVTAIYGQNASGKSTFLSAILKLFALITNSRKNNEEDDFDLIYYDKKKVITFKAKFIVGKTFYFYEVSLCGNNKEARVQNEVLTNITENKLLFSRKKQEIKDYNFISEPHLDILNSDLQKNHFVLSQPFSFLNELKMVFIQKNNGFMDVPLSHFQKKIVMPDVLINTPLSFSFITKSIREELLKPDTKTFILNELKQADFHITDFYFNDENELIFTNSKGLSLSFAEQSDGTRKYFILLVDVKLNILDTGGMYVVDELEKALHPRLAMRFINLFKSKETNPKNARLLFSSHDLGFLHHSVLNGDQVHFIERNDDTDETEIFSPAEDVNFDPFRLQADYMHGAYGAVPKTEWGF
jgi:uncharacterized protein